MWTEELTTLYRSDGFHKTRVSPFMLTAPFLFHAFHDYIVLSMEIEEDRWLDRQYIVDMIATLFVLKIDFGEHLWDMSPHTKLVELTDAEIDTLWEFVRSGLHEDSHLFGEHPWDYFRRAWHEASGEWLPERLDPEPVALGGGIHAYYFKRGVAHCIHRFRPLSYA